MGTGSTIPYQLRPHKAIERNLYAAILRKLDRCSNIDLPEYRYVGFGAPFLEDFKIMHTEFGITDMHCIEYDKNAFSRQLFNNPYNFIELFPESSTDYITGTNFKQNKNQIIWLDYASPGEIRQQLQDIEFLCAKVAELDIIKFTFNAYVKAFIGSHHLRLLPYEINRIISFLRRDPTYQIFVPDEIRAKDIYEDFSALIRVMALRSIKRGLAKGGKDLVFNHIASFSYADGQVMTTMTGIISKPESSKKILIESGLVNWEFYQPEPSNEIILANEITVPVMTISERVLIDKLMPNNNAPSLVSKIKFAYGNDDKENEKLLEGYCKYYRYLPYYSKVSY